MQKIKFNSSSLSLFHLSTCSLNKNFDDLECLLKTTYETFGVIANSESTILKNQKITKNINLPNYVIEYTGAESQAGSDLLYINNQLVYKPKTDMNIYSSYELEPRVIEIINRKNTITVIDCIYRHPSMDLNEFNNIYLSKPLDFILKENKTEFLLGDFNSNLLKYEKYDPAIEFLDSFSSNMF